MADFLASDDDIDFERAASAFPDISLDGSGDIPTLATQNSTTSFKSNGSGFSFDDFDAPAPTNVKVTGDDELEKFTSSFPEIETPAPAVSTPQPKPSLFGTTVAPQPQSSAFSSTPILNQNIEEDEPEVIREWREKQAEEIAAREERAKARRQETISKAEKAIDDFYEDYAAKKERTIGENKQQENEYIHSLQNSLATGTTWERICELVELQNSQSKTIARTGPNTTDLSRMKEVLLRLKREGDAAPGAGGY